MLSIRWKKKSGKCRITRTQLAEHDALDNLSKQRIAECLDVLIRELGIVTEDDYGHFIMDRPCECGMEVPLIEEVPSRARPPRAVPAQKDLSSSVSGRDSTSPPTGDVEEPSSLHLQRSQTLFEEYLQEKDGSPRELRARRVEKRPRRPRRKRKGPVEDWGVPDLVAYFALEYMQKLVYRHRCAPEINKGAIGKSIRKWIDEGLNATVVKAMIDYFCEHPEYIQDKNTPGWRIFIYRKDQLLRRVMEAVDAGSDERKDPDWWLGSDETELDKDSPRADPAWWFGSD